MLFERTGWRADNPGTSAATSAPVLPQEQQVAHHVDASKPTTSLQIRTAEGSRLVEKFNTTSSLGELKRFAA